MYDQVLLNIRQTKSKLCVNRQRVKVETERIE